MSDPLNINERWYGVSLKRRQRSRKQNSGRQGWSCKCIRSRPLRIEIIGFAGFDGYVELITAILQGNGQMRRLAEFPRQAA